MPAYDLVDFEDDDIWLGFEYARPSMYITKKEPFEFENVNT